MNAAAPLLVGESDVFRDGGLLVFVEGFFFVSTFRSLKWTKSTKRICYWFISHFYTGKCHQTSFLYFLFPLKAVLCVDVIQCLSSFVGRCALPLQNGPFRVKRWCFAEEILPSNDVKAFRVSGASMCRNYSGTLEISNNIKALKRTQSSP